MTTSSIRMRKIAMLRNLVSQCIDSGRDVDLSKLIPEACMTLQTSRRTILEYISLISYELGLIAESGVLKKKPAEVQTEIRKEQP